jgi:hypothetical protein
LLSIAKEKDDAVAQNFFKYLQMLVGEAGGPPRSPLASDADLVVPAWQAAWRVRPQPKMEGYVVELVKGLRAALKDDGTSIPMPSWVKSSEEESTSGTAAPMSVPDGEGSPAVGQLVQSAIPAKSDPQA